MLEESGADRGVAFRVSVRNLTDPLSRTPVFCDAGEVRQMTVIQAIVGTLIALSGICFLLLAVSGAPTG